jgi:hypothetical protein
MQVNMHKPLADYVLLALLYKIILKNANKLLYFV